MCELVVLAATWIFEISYRSAYVGLLVFHLLLLFTETLAHCRNLVRLYYFGICPSKLAELVPLPYSHGRSCRYSNRMHDFSVIPRCYKNLYVNSIFSHIASLWNSLPATSFPSIYDLNVFMSTVNRHIFRLFLNNFLKSFSLFSSSYPGNFISCSGCSVFYGLNPSKKVKNHGNKRKVCFLLPLEHISKW